MSKFARLIDVLDLYSKNCTLLTAEEISERLNVSRPTAFRYARELSTAGFLANYAGHYSLGARIITLDYRIRESDPVLKVAKEVMKQLAVETGSGVILCRMYNEDAINVHHEPGHNAVAFSFDRGRPLPLFRGAASKIMLAFLPVARLKKIFENHKHDPDLLALASNWPEFKASFTKIRARGYYVSRQEVDQGIVGIAAPITLPGAGVVAVISLVFSVERQPLVNIEGFAALVVRHADEIARQLGSLSLPPPNSN
jgi:DNA-binding IclR family transcriptional regulator